MGWVIHGHVSYKEAHLSMQHWLNRALLLAALSFALLLSLSSKTRADVRSPSSGIELVDADPIGGVDVVFLIDNSGSMFCTFDEEMNCTGDGSDPSQWRFEIVRAMTSWLAADNLNNQSRYPSREHRLGVVTFGTGDRTEADVDLLSLRTMSDAQLQERETQVDTLLRRDNLGRTDYVAAYTRAADLPWDQPVSDKPRIKALIMLTDGHPWVPSIAGVARELGDGSQNPEFLPTYFRELGALLDEQFPAASEPESTDGYHRWVVYLGPDWGPVRSYWSDLVGSNWRQVLSYSEIPKVIYGIMSTIYPMGELVTPAFDMPPYLSEVTFTVYGLTPLVDASAITFAAPGNRTLEASDYERSKTYGEAVIRREVSNPEPGRWSYTPAPDVKVEVSWDRFLPDLVLVEPEVAPTQLTRTSIAFRLEDAEREPIYLLPAYPLTIDAQLNTPSDKTIPLTFAQAGDGLLVSNEPILLADDGDYVLDVSVATTYGDGLPWPVVPPTRLRFRVGPPESQLAFRDASPVLAPFHIHTLDLLLYSATGDPIAIDPAYAPTPHIQAPTSRRTRVLEGPTSQGDATYATTLFVTDQDIAAGQISAHVTVQASDGATYRLTGASLAQTSVGSLQLANASPQPGKQIVKQGVPATIAFDLIWEGGAFTPAPEAPLDVSSSFLRSPAGETFPLDGLRQNGDGHYALSYTFEQPGQWQVHILGSVETPWGESVKAFEETVWAVDVIETTQASLDIVRPSHGEQLPYREPETLGTALWFTKPDVQPLELTLQALVAQGTPSGSGTGAIATPWPDLADPGAAITDLLSVSLVGPDRSDYASRLRWRVDPDDSSMLRATLSPPYPQGIYRLSVDWQPGAQDLMPPRYAPKATGGRYVEFQALGDSGIASSLCQMIPYAWLGLLAALVAWIMNGRSQRLAGSLMVREMGGTAREHRYPIAKRWRWLTIRPTNWLATAHRVKRLQVKAERADTVRVTLRAKGSSPESSTLSRAKPAFRARKGALEIRYEPARRTAATASRASRRVRKPPRRRGM
jgi:hypothetical protein